MTIHLGDKALDNYLNEKGLIESLPSADTLDWIKIDIEGKMVNISLL